MKGGERFFSLVRIGFSGLTRLGRGWPFFLFAVAVLLLYGPTLTYPFVWLDDYVLIQQRMEELRDFRNWFRPFTEHYFRPSSIIGLYYRPLVTLSYMADAWIGEGRIGCFRFTNLMLHILASWGVFLLVREGIERCGRKGVFPGLMGAFVFAVHPVHVMAVAWVPGRNDLLLAVLALASFLGFLWHERTKNAGAMGLHLVALFFALLTKEAAVVIPVLCALWALGVSYKPPDFETTTRLSVADRLGRLPWAGWGGILLLWILLRLTVLGVLGVRGFSDSLGHAFAVIPGLFVRYYGKAVIPTDLRLIPTFSDSSPFWGVVSVFLTFLAILRFGGREFRIALFGLGWLALWLILSLPFGNPGEREELGLLEHRLYVPLAGLVLFGTVALTGRSGETHTVSFRLLKGGAVGFFLLALGFRTWKRLPDLNGPEIFWRAVERESPRCGMAGIGLSEFYLQSGRLEEALDVLERTRTHHPRQENLHLNLGRYYRARRQYPEAERMLQREIALHPYSLRAYVNLAALYREWDRPEDARLWEWRGDQVLRAMERQTFDPFGTKQGTPP